MDQQHSLQIRFEAISQTAEKINTEVPAGRSVSAETVHFFRSLYNPGESS
jgi:hypothetical protein